MTENSSARKTNKQKELTLAENGRLTGLLLAELGDNKKMLNTLREYGSEYRTEAEIAKCINIYEDWIKTDEAILEKLRDGQQNMDSDAALIKSLNRYIEALEGKADMQDELIQELRKNLNAQRAAYPGRQEQ